jgi:DAACS family dicarboxylate/amino acid:cation (Na+ or H+) symporter
MTKRKGLALHWLMLAGFLIGAAAGIWVHYYGGEAPWVQATAAVTDTIGQLFLRGLFMLMLPLLFSALVVGVAEMGDLGSLGRAGLKTLGLTVLVSTIAVLIGLGMVNWFRPGDGVNPEDARQFLTENAARAQGIIERAPKAVEPGQFFLDLVPQNVFAAAAEGQFLPVMVYSILFGVGLVLVRSRATDQLQLIISGLFEVMMKLIGLVIAVAPIAVACLMFNLAAAFGWDLLVRLGAYTAVAIAAMAIHMFVVYPLVVMLLGGWSPIKFFSGIRAPMLVAFSTASSNATLPVSLRAAEHELNLPRKIARFVLTVGATANQNGTALFEGVTVLFLAQFFNVHLTLNQQIIVMLVCILGGIGTAGVPAGSLPVIVMILGMVGVPPAGIGIVLGVDRFLDMCRTTLNVTGDLAVAAVVSRGEKDDVPAASKEHQPFVAAS